MKWVEFHRVRAHELETRECPWALFVFPKPIPCRSYKDLKTYDIVFEKLADDEVKIAPAVPERG